MVDLGQHQLERLDKTLEDSRQLGRTGTNQMILFALGALAANKNGWDTYLLDNTPMKLAVSGVVGLVLVLWALNLIANFYEVKRIVASITERPSGTRNLGNLRVACEAVLATKLQLRYQRPLLWLRLVTVAGPVIFTCVLLTHANQAFFCAMYRSGAGCPGTAPDAPLPVPIPPAHSRIPAG